MIAGQKLFPPFLRLVERVDGEMPRYAIFPNGIEGERCGLVIHKTDGVPDSSDR